jgi:hypothetical protein
VVKIGLPEYKVIIVIEEGKTERIGKQSPTPKRGFGEKS